VLLWLSTMVLVDDRLPDDDGRAFKIKQNLNKHLNLLVGCIEDEVCKHIQTLVRNFGVIRFASDLANFLQWCVLETCAPSHFIQVVI